jgi:hypothetical protein
MRRLTVVIGLLFSLAQAGRAEEANLSLFQQGAKRLSVGAGYGTFNDNGYFILGLGAGYDIVNNLELGLDGEVWAGSTPGIETLSPRLTYYIPLGEQRWEPYVGGFAKRTFYNSRYDNLNSAGGRVGVVTAIGAHTYLTGGLVFEQFLNCDASVYSHCSQTYPELGLGFTY